MWLWDVYKKSFPTFECKSEWWQIIQALKPHDASTILNAMFEFRFWGFVWFETEEELKKNYLLDVIWHYFKVDFMNQKLNKFKDLQKE